MDYPEDLRYTTNDEWLRVEGEIAVTGVSDYAQDQLSDVVYVEITAEVGDTLSQGDAFGMVESVKAAADLYMPVSGTLTEINEALSDTPELVNREPYTAAWMIKYRLAEPEQVDQLMDSTAYVAHLKGINS